MPDIFISYSRDDQATARRFAEAFEREGFTVWWDQTLNPGDAYDHVTEKALKEAKAVAVLWSKKSVESRWVRAEATQANRNQTLVPIMIEPCDRPIMFELTQTANLSHWNGDPHDGAWQSYVAGVRRFIRKDAPAAGPHAVGQPATGRRRTYGPLAITISVAVLVVAGVVLWSLNRAPGSSAKQAEVVASTTPTATKEVTLAVLPFVDLSPGKDQEYFADGLSEEILNQVAQVKGLQVTARTSSFAFKGKNDDMRVIGEKLGVANLLEGSIRKDGDQLRITAQLISSSNGAHLWSQTYDRQLSKIFELQEEIARDVAATLSVKLDVGDMRRANGGTTNVEAYEMFLRSNGAFRHGDFARHDQYLREVVKLDPEFVSAWLSIFLTTDRNHPDHAEALNHLKTLAPKSWQTSLAEASALEVDRSWFEAYGAYEASRAAVDTGNGEISIDAYEAQFFREVGDIRMAERLWQPLAKDATTFIPFPYWTLRHLLYLGNYKDALAEMDRSKSLPAYPVDSDFEFLMNLRFRKNSNPSAVWSNYASVVKKSTLLQSLSPVRANPTAARAVLHQAFEDPATKEENRTERIVVWADYFGDKDLALAAMRRGLFDTHDFQSTQIWWPYATNLRTDPRFKDIVRELGMVDYWRRSGNWGDFCSPVGTDDFECR